MDTVVNYSEDKSCDEAVVQLIGSQLQLAATAWNVLDADCRPSSSPAAYNFTRTTTVVFDRSPSFPVWHVSIFGLLAVCVCLLTISGNLIVILSFVLERSIRQPTNYFIASLAVSDLLIGSVSMPFYTVYLLSGKYWPLGEALCDLWLSLDYTACLCSIYTVFCITADRYCSVRLPASYRKWRTERKVTVMVCLTWLIPMAVFFTSIFGWQHFVGYRSVPTGKCYVQYMEDALFNCLLQVGYFWITLAAMIALYVGIYRIALGLHRRSVAQRERSIACLVSMAGGAVTQLGSAIGMTCPDGRAPPPADAPAAAAVHQRHGDDDDDDDDDDDYPHTVETPHVASRLPTLLLPATSFALFGRLGASRRHDSHGHDSGCQKKTTTATNLPASRSSSEARPHTDDKTAPPGCTVVKNEGSLSTAMTCSEKNDRAANLNGVQPPSSARRQKRDAASAVTARPEDLHDLPYFDDCDTDDRLQPGKMGTADDSGNISEVGCAESSTTAVSSAISEQRVVRFFTATDDVAVAGCDTSPTHHEDVVLLKTSCNGGRPLAAQSSASTSSHLQQQHNRYTSGLASQVWRHVVMHKEGRHAESRLDKSPEPDERQALLRASYPRPGDAERKRLQQLTRNNHRTRKALRTITIILGAFMVCWIPWHVLSLIIGFSCEHGTLSCSVAPTLYDISYWICYLNSPINPFCYAFANQQFKKTFIRIMRLDWRRS